MSDDEYDVEVEGGFDSFMKKIYGGGDLYYMPVNESDASDASSNASGSAASSQSSADGNVPYIPESDDSVSVDSEDENSRTPVQKGKTSKSAKIANEPKVKKVKEPKVKKVKEPRSPKVPKAMKEPKSPKSTRSSTRLSTSSKKSDINKKINTLVNSVATENNCEECNEVKIEEPYHSDESLDSNSDDGAVGGGKKKFTKKSSVKPGVTPGINPNVKSEVKKKMPYEKPNPNIIQDYTNETINILGSQIEGSSEDEYESPYIDKINEPKYKEPSIRGSSTGSGRSKGLSAHSSSYSLTGKGEIGKFIEPEQYRTRSSTYSLSGRSDAKFTELEQASAKELPTFKEPSGSVRGSSSSYSLTSRIEPGRSAPSINNGSAHSSSYSISGGMRSGSYSESSPYISGGVEIKTLVAGRTETDSAYGSSDYVDRMSRIKGGAERTFSTSSARSSASSNLSTSKYQSVLSNYALSL